MMLLKLEIQLTMNGPVMDGESSISTNLGHRLPMIGPRRPRGRVGSQVAGVRARAASLEVCGHHQKARAASLVITGKVSTRRML